MDNLGQVQHEAQIMKTTTITIYHVPQQEVTLDVQITKPKQCLLGKK